MNEGTPQVSRGWILLAIVSLACSTSEVQSSSAKADAGTALACDDAPDPHCDNPINRLLIPKFRAARIAPRDASPSEICRRLSLDLIGRIPTLAELEQCEKASPGDRVERLMALDDYPRFQASRWARTLRLETDLGWYPVNVEIDRYVRSYYRGDLTYPRFAAQTLFASYVAGEPFHTFLGRTMQTDEESNFAPMLNLFSLESFCDGNTWYLNYRQAKTQGKTEEEAKRDADGSCVAYYGVIDFCRCNARVLQGGGCSGELFGVRYDLGEDGCIAGGVGRRFWASDPARETSKLCPDGIERDECESRRLTVDSLGNALFTPMTPREALTDAQRERLFVIGDILAGQLEFWETAADRELSYLLGWWKTGYRIPDRDLPDVRAYLAHALASGMPVRELQKQVVTSLLYSAPSESVDEATPPWASGPTKFLSAEPWLDSVGVAVGETLGSCDQRALAALSGISPSRLTYFDPKYQETREPSIGPPYWSTAKYIETAENLGGCLAAPRPVKTSVGLVHEQNVAARLFCGVGREVIEPGFDPKRGDDALDGAVRYLVRRTLSRNATEEEVRTLREDMRACMAAGEEGCAGSEETALRWACARLIDSASFALY